MTWIVRSVLAWAKGYLEGKGVESPRLDAEVLLAHALGTERIHLYLDMDRPLSGEELSAYRVLLKRRSLREPVAYILGFREFFSHSFLVSPDVLIPRPETELLVEEAVEISPPGSEVFELGVGSGAVIVSILLSRPDLVGHGNDTSMPALAIARENARRHGMSERLSLFAGAGLAALSGRYSTIVANPPYIALSEENTLQEEVLRFEPRAALFAGNDGLDVIREILCAVQDNLVPGGRLVMETGSGQGPEVERIIRNNRNVRLVRWVKDLAGFDRAVVVERTHG